MLNDRISLVIPSKADYISIIRLTTSGIANNLNLSVDEIEDIKVCVGEACVNVLHFTNFQEILAKFTITDDSINIKIENVVEDIPEDMEYQREGELGLIIIKSLMDKVIFSDSGIEMIKYI